MYLRLDVDGKRGNARLKPSIGMRQRTREVYEALGSGGGHTGQSFVETKRFRSFEDAVWAWRGVGRLSKRRGPA